MGTAADTRDGILNFQGAQVIDSKRFRQPVYVHVAWWAGATTRFLALSHCFKIPAQH